MLILSFVFASIQDSRVGVLHHVCGEHEWSLGSCKHGPLTENEPKKVLDKNSKTMEALRDIVWDKRFIKSLEHYTLFR